jgi:hypothetical protein
LQQGQTGASADQPPTSLARRGAAPLCPRLMQPLPRTVADKITAAEQLKQEGNEHFKSKEFKKAIGCYQRVEAIRHASQCRLLIRRLL